MSSTLMRCASRRTATIASRASELTSATSLHAVARSCSRRVALQPHSSTLAPSASAAVMARHSAASRVEGHQQRRSFTSLHQRGGVGASVSAPPHAERVGERLIPVIGRIQEVSSLVGDAGVELPQIVVIGAQSSGKSSVLENIVGRDFLPRGGDLVTRRPLILQLHRLEDPAAEDYAEFGHKPGQRFLFEGRKKAGHSSNPVREEIVAETDRLLSPGSKSISSEPISLHIYSPRVLPLTLIDTPGLTRVPVGDQPADIEKRIRSMLYQFIQAENTIILAVSGANQDLATSDSLQMAREVDPEGKRTIGVITKLDLMDKGTEHIGLRTLLGEAIPLRLGYIGVVNRGQADIDADRKIDDALDRERDFFLKHSTFNVVAERSGTGHLAKTCNRLLSDHIQQSLPNLRKQVRVAYANKQAELERLGAPVRAEDAASQGWLLLHLINRITDQYRATIAGVDGDPDSTQDDTEMKEFNGGARLRFIFHDTFAQQMAQVDALKGLTNNDIKTTIRNAAGPRPSLFVPERAFENLVRRQIELLRDPCYRAAELTLDELLRMIWSLETRKNSELARFPVLRAKVTEIGAATLRDALQPTLDHIDALLACEAAYLNTQHPQFLGKDSMLGAQPEDPNSVQSDGPATSSNSKSGPVGFFSSLFGGSSTPPPPPSSSTSSRQVVPSRLEPGHELSERDKRQIAMLRKLLSSYFSIVQSNMQDATAKAIMHFLVNRSKQDLHKNLVHELYREEKYRELLQEDPSIASRRESCRRQLEALTMAKSLLQEAEVLA